MKTKIAVVVPFSLLVLALVGLLALQQYYFTVALKGAQKEIVTMRQNVVELRGTLDEMRLSAASATIGFDHLQDSMNLAVVESIQVVGDAAQTLNEIKGLTDYMSTWLTTNFPIAK